MDKIAVVTGATGGIGTAIVEKLLTMGVKVCITDKETDALEQFKNTLLKRYKAKEYMVIPMDVEDLEAIQSAEQEIHTHYEQVDILVNNAGIFESIPFLEMEESAFLKMLNINLLGTFRVSQVFGRGMIKQRRGKIINIGSIAGTKGMLNGAHYAASKAGITALSMSMAQEFAPHNVQVNVVLPGFIETPMMDSAQDALKVIAAWRIPAKRLGLPWEVAETVGFLASSESAYLTGTQIVIDGGLSLG